MDSQDPGLKDHAKHYPSSGYHDELAWGALWIYLATQEDAYMQTALKCAPALPVFILFFGLLRSFSINQNYEAIALKGR